MPTISLTHTEQNPAFLAGSGGGTGSHTVTEPNPTGAAGSGGGRRNFLETELVPVPAEGYGGGRRVLTLEEISPLLSLPIPEVTTGPATEIGLVEAVVNGFLEDDGGLFSNCAFEWGLTGSYGRITPLQSKTEGERFSQILTGLEPDTIYHFRARASNAFGLSNGSDMIFRTLSSSMTPPYFHVPLLLLLEGDTL